MEDSNQEYQGEGMSQIPKEKCPVSGMTEYLYEHLRGVINPESEGAADFWEIGDKVIQGYDVRCKAHFVKLVNDVADRLEILERVGLIREIKGADAKAAQKRQFTEVLDHIAERIREEPDLIFGLPAFGQYDAWRETNDIRLKYEAYLDANEPEEAPEEEERDSEDLDTDIVVITPEGDAEIATPISSPTHILESTPTTTPTPELKAKAAERKRRHEKIEFEKMKRGIRKSCANLGYDAEGMLCCLEFDGRPTPARCGKCKRYEKARG